LSAVEIGVFGTLADGPLDLLALRRRLGLHPRAARDFFDALVALDLLRRDDDGRYSNSAESAGLLDLPNQGISAVSSKCSMPASMLGESHLGNG
jgi:DNA-binding IclR family transcriptional regulator